jgi:hypothetical protein
MIAVPSWLVYQQQQAVVGELNAQTETNRRLNQVALDYFKQRHRPIIPGASAAHVASTTGTVCCIVRPRGGGETKFLLLSGDFESEFTAGDAVLQPGPFDGGRAPDDVVAYFARFLRPNFEAPNSATGSIAAVISAVQVSNTIPGFGPIRGVADDVELGQELFIAGRTSGLQRVIVSRIHVSSIISFDRGEATFTGLIGLRGAGAVAASEGGDAGAPILTPDGRLAAMLFAGSTEESLAVPIRQVFDALNVELDTEPP